MVAANARVEKARNGTCERIAEVETRLVRSCGAVE